MSIFRTFLIAFSCLLALACSDQKQQAAQRFEHAAQGAFSSAVSNDGKYSLVSSIHHGVALWDNQQQVLKYQWFQQQLQAMLVHAYVTNNSEGLAASESAVSCSKSHPLPLQRICNVCRL